MKYFLFITFFIATFYSNAQDLGGFIQVAGKDSLIMHYWSSGILQNKPCADYYRVAKMHPQYYVFDGLFKDYYATGELAREGTYSANHLHGDYISYYINGQPKERGKFNDGVKVGQWEYWYENGQLKKVIDFRVDGPLVHRLYNRKGKALVEGGNGEFRESSDVIKGSVKGEIKDGKQHGKWKIYSDYKNTLTGIEIFDNGKLVEGESLATYSSFNEKYFDSPRSSVDFSGNELINYTHYTNCRKPGKKNSYHFKKYNSKNTELPFYDYIYENFDPGDAGTGYILISFKVTKQGDVANINYYSTISNQEVERELVNVISSSDKWEPEVLNGKPIESTELFSFAFSNDEYRILNDSRNDYLPVEYGANIKQGKAALYSFITTNIDVAAKPLVKEKNLAVTVAFTVNENGTVSFDNSIFESKLKVSEAERYLHEELKSLINSTGSWEPATYNGERVKHHFQGVLNIKDGIPKFRLFSNNYVLQEAS